MKIPIKYSCVLAATFMLPQPATAVELNIINLVQGGDLIVNVSFDSTSQNMIVKSREYSGSFGLPKTLVTLSANADKPTEIKIPETDDSQLAIFHAVPDGFKWSLVPSKPLKEKWGLRIVNLSDMDLPILVKEKEVRQLAPGSDTAMPVEGKGEIRLRIDDAETHSYRGNEPCAVVAIVFREMDSWKVVFVPEY